MINKMAQGCGLNLAILYEQNKNNTGFKYAPAQLLMSLLTFITIYDTLFICRYCNIREVELCRLENADIKRFRPYTYSTLCDPSKV